MAQLMPSPLTVSCFSKIQIGFSFLVLAHPGTPGQRCVYTLCIRMHHFVVKLSQYFLRLRRQGGTDPPVPLTKIMRTPLNSDNDIGNELWTFSGTTRAPARLNAVTPPASTSVNCNSLTSCHSNGSGVPHCRRRTVNRVRQMARAYSKEFFGVHNFKSSCMM